MAVTQNQTAGTMEYIRYRNKPTLPMILNKGTFTKAYIREGTLNKKYGKTG